MPRPKNLCATLLVLLCLRVGSVAQGGDTDEERIRSFDSRISVNIDDSMQVQESIAVQAAGIAIRHGIYRDFPTRYSDVLGNRYTVGFQVAAVQRDGRSEPWHAESIADGVRVYFGDKNSEISHGIHRYVFTYNTTRQLGFFKDHDELYWNVTGVRWAFPIDNATATVILPTQVRNSIRKLDGYTGAQGQQGKDFVAWQDQEGNPHFRAQHLAAHQGLTIVVTWPKGLVPEPTREQKIKWFLSDNLSASAGLAGLLIVLLYYLVVWVRVGRDPKAGTVVPLYEPPDNMSPASMRYLEKMAFDDKAFSSAILGLAAKGCLTIDDDKSHRYVLKQTGESGRADSQLSSDEKILLQKLFQNSKTVHLSSENSSAILRARKALETALHTGMEKIYFVTNAGYLWPGLVLTIGSAVAMLLATGSQLGGSRLFVGIFMTVWLSVWSLGVGALLHSVSRAWKAARASKVAGGAGAVGITLFTIPFLVGEIVGLGMLAWAISIVGVLIILLLIGSNVLFHHLLKAPTHAGRQLLDRVDGFKMFLSEVDGQRLNMVAPPSKTPELFQRFLPYALALDVEHAWAEQFSQVLATAGGPGAETGVYSPSWYNGSFIASSPAVFASSFSSSFSSAISASSSPPGSSSGGGGGGSSGGGGGGGGGGGW